MSGSDLPSRRRIRTRQFSLWADEQDTDEVSDLSGRTAEKFENYRMNECEIDTITLEAHLRTVRLLLRWCEANEAEVSAGRL